MQQFDVYPMPNVGQRRERPFVLVLQHDRLNFTRSVIVAPLSRLKSVAVRERLLRQFKVTGEDFVLITHEMSAIDRRILRGEPIDNLEGERYAIMNALDAVFSAAG